jgi:catechol 2,3-dioxygenase-like lactoylglutathione lyase family enzyme
MYKLFLLLAITVLSTTIKAQDSTSFTLTFNHVALSVKDVDRSAEFYKNVLKLQEITNRTEMKGIRWFSLSEGKELHLVSVIKETVLINKAVHFALATSNFDALIKSLEIMNIPFSDWPGTANKITIRADGIKQIYFQDRDGYWIEVNSAN